MKRSFCLFFAAFVAVAFASDVYAQRSSGRVPVDKPPVDEDGEPEDASTPIGEIRNVVDALRLLNDAARKQSGAFDALETKVAAIQADFQEKLADFEKKLGTAEQVDLAKEMKPLEEKIDAVSASVEEVKAAQTAQATQAESGAAEIQKVAEKVATLEGSTMSEEEFLGALEKLTARDVENYNQFCAKLDAAKVDEIELARALEPAPRAATPLDWVNSSAAWLAALYAIGRTLVLTVGFFKRRIAQARNLRERLAAFERGNATQTTQPTQPTNEERTGTPNLLGGVDARRDY